MPSTKSSSKSKAQEKITPVISIGPVSGGISDVQRVLTQVKVDVEKDLSVNEQFVDDNETFLTTDGSLKVASALSQVQRLATNWAQQISQGVVLCSEQVLRHLSAHRGRP